MNRGFIALSLVISIASILLAFSYMQSIDIAHFFDQTKLKEYRLMNYYNAQSCIDQALLALAHDFFYETSTSTEISYLHCAIDMVQNEQGRISIKAHGNYKNINVVQTLNARLFDNKIEVVQ